jgi:hypothetical protein
MRSLRVVALCALVVFSGCSASSQRGNVDLSVCGATNVGEQEPLGQRGRWRSVPYAQQRNRYQRSRPEVFAGTYLSGSHVFVGFTEDVCKNVQEFRKGLSEPWRVRGFKARFSFRRLRQAQQCVVEMRHDERLGFSGVGADVFRNQTGVMLKEDSEDRRELIESECGEAEGEDLFYFEEGTYGST